LTNWHHKRLTAHGTFLRAKQTVTVAIDFLNWLTQNGCSLPGLTQAHLDAWQAQGPTTRELASRFLLWGEEGALGRPGFTMTRHSRGTSVKLSASGQDEAVRRVVHTTELTSRDRAAAILVVVFAEQIENVIKLTWDDVQITEYKVTVRIGQTDISLPAPLDQPVRQVAAASSNTAAHPNSNWVFPGYSPGRHIRAASLRERLPGV
jgi:hypothetical protein